MNQDVGLTLDEAVAEVLGHLTGLDLQLIPEHDRYQSIVRQINRALRSVALENEWSYYSDYENIGHTIAGTREVSLRSSIRPRVIHDDMVRLVHPVSKETLIWAKFLPREALNKYENRRDLWVSYTRNLLSFSRRIHPGEQGLEIHLPVMREPRMFQLPVQPTDPNQPLIDVPLAVRNQLVDFDYPDLVVMKAAYYYAQTDPVMQPRVQTLDSDYKTLMYALTERDTRSTDSPYQNDWNLGIQSDIGGISGHGYGRPLADERGFYNGWSG